MRVETAIFNQLAREHIGVYRSGDIQIRPFQRELEPRCSTGFDMPQDQPSLQEFASKFGTTTDEILALANDANTPWITFHCRSKLAQSGQGLVPNNRLHNFLNAPASYPEQFPGIGVTIFHPNSLIRDEGYLQRIKHDFHPYAQVIPVQVPDPTTYQLLQPENAYMLQIPIDTYYVLDPDPNQGVDLSFLLQNFSHRDRNLLDRTIDLQQTDPQTALNHLATHLNGNPRSGFIVSATTGLCIPPGYYAEVSGIQVGPQALYNHLPALMLDPHNSLDDKRDIRWEHSCHPGNNQPRLPTHTELTIFKAIL